MLTTFLAFALLICAQCAPPENEKDVDLGALIAIPNPEKDETAATDAPKPEEPKVDPGHEGGAPPPGDLSESGDANPSEQGGPGADLDTDATIWGGWGWGYRPYYRSYSYSPWRRWGGYGWGGRGYGGWGWGGRGWGWGGGYWG